LNASVASGWVAILTCELHFPEAHSLKEKRQHLRSAKAQLQSRVGASVAEVDHHDVWQRARITVACVAREHREAERLLDEAERQLDDPVLLEGRLEEAERRLEAGEISQDELDAIEEDVVLRLMRGGKR